MNTRKKTAYISSPSRSRLPNRRRKSQFWPKLKNFVRINKNILLVAVIVILTSIIARYLYSTTIGKPGNVIDEIIFTDQDVQMYSNKDFYTFIREQLRGRNIVLIKLKNGGKVKDIIENAYPFVKDMSFEKIGDKKISVSIDYYSADLLFRNEAFSVGYANKSLFTTNDNDGITSGAIIITLPAYFSGDVIENKPEQYISLLGPEKFKNEFTLITSRIPVQEILLLAGAQKSIILSDNKKISFDHKRSIEAQLEYLSAITKLDPSLFYEIDLTVYPRVIIKKVPGF